MDYIISGKNKTKVKTICFGREESQQRVLVESVDPSARLPGVQLPTVSLNIVSCWGGGLSFSVLGGHD